MHLNIYTLFPFKNIILRGDPRAPPDKDVNGPPEMVRNSALMHGGNRVFQTSVGFQEDSKNVVNVLKSYTTQKGRGGEFFQNLILKYCHFHSFFSKMECLRGARQSVSPFLQSGGRAAGITGSPLFLPLPPTFLLKADA